MNTNGNRLAIYTPIDQENVFSITHLGNNESNRIDKRIATTTTTKNHTCRRTVDTIIVGRTLDCTGSMHRHNKA